MSAHKLLPVALLLSLSVISTAHAASCEKQSATTRIPLVELYTSEGCSSCPVADRWLSELAPEIVSADEMVALAFHVDYWDRLGWKDRFASPAYTERQKTNSKVNGSAYVFTPQIVLAGRNYERWQDSKRVQQDVRKVLAVAPDATLILRQQPAMAGKLGFEVQEQLRQGVSPADVRIHTALVQNGLVSNISKGENSGSKLHHDYVVRSFVSSSAVDQSGQLTFKNSFTLPDDAQLEKMGVVVFAQDNKTGVVLQAMAAPLCADKKL